MPNSIRIANRERKFVTLNLGDEIFPEEIYPIFKMNQKQIKEMGNYASVKEIQDDGTVVFEIISPEKDKGKAFSVTRSEGKEVYKKLDAEGKVVEEGCYDEDTKDITWKTYHGSNSFSVDTYNKDNILNGPHKMYVQGKLSSEGSYKNGKKCGTWKKYGYKNGKQFDAELTTYNENGVLSGLYEKRDADGNLVENGSYENGNRVGEWKFYKDGQEYTGIYDENGQPYNGIFDIDGVLCTYGEGKLKTSESQKSNEIYWDQIKDRTDLTEPQKEEIKNAIAVLVNFDDWESEEKLKEREKATDTLNNYFNCSGNYKIRTQVDGPVYVYDNTMMMGGLVTIEDYAIDREYAPFDDWEKYKGMTNKFSQKLDENGEFVFVSGERPKPEEPHNEVYWDQIKDSENLHQNKKKK